MAFESNLFISNRYCIRQFIIFNVNTTYTATLALVVCFCLFGLALRLMDNQVTLSIVALVITMAAMSYRMLQVRLYWMHSMVSPADSAQEKGE